MIFQQSKIEKGRMISERIKSAITKEFAGHHPEESEGSFKIQKNPKVNFEPSKQIKIRLGDRRRK